MSVRLINQPYTSRKLLFIVFAFVESFALIGIIVPGVLLLAAAAFIAGTGALSLQATLICAFIGAVAGDGERWPLRCADSA